MLYNLIIRPIEYLVEVIYLIMYRLFGNAGIAIIAVSLCISLLTLPLYMKAEGIQEKIRKGQKEMDHWLRHIRKHFKAEERQMVLFAYYKEKNYSPIYALAGLAPLLLQVPFFIAAYRFLSQMKPQSVLSFWCIADLMEEDGLLRLSSGAAVNLLPVLMTLINVVSALIYLKESTWKDKLQPLALALFFLILLYHSPSGLVLYWTCNNLFSLGKNIAMKTMKHPERMIGILSLGSALLIVLRLCASGKLMAAVRGREDELLLYALLILILLLVAFAMSGRNKRKTVAEKAVPFSFVLISETVLVLLLGVIQPLLIIDASPLEFLEADHGAISPFHYVFFSFCIAAGIVYLWGNLFYYMSDRRVQNVYASLLGAGAVVFTVNSFAFDWGDYTISTLLVYDLIPRFENTKIWYINLAVIAAAAVLTILLYHRSQKILHYLMCSLMMALTVFSLYHTARIAGELGKNAEDFEVTEIAPVTSLSRTEKNVVVIMLDRAIGAYVPYVFDERPELAEQFDGFTFYPNTTSYGDKTIHGAPPLYGGYEYTPEGMNERSETLLSEKYKEALSVMPYLFEDACCRVTAADLPNLSMALPDGVADEMIFAERPEISYHSLCGSLPANYDPSRFVSIRERNFFFCGVLKCMPAVYRDEVYDEGRYLSANRMSVVSSAFLDNYEVLYDLPELTTASDEESGSFFVLCNETTHEPTILSLPDYDVFGEADNHAYDICADHTVGGRALRFDRSNPEYSVGHYHSFMASFIALGNWFDCLREWGVYDNTKIILVADHGRDLGQFDDMIMSAGIDAESVNALLMVKDFGAEGFATDESFMTVADVPAIAADGVLAAPVQNPFTGNVIDMSGKENGAGIIFSKVGSYGERTEYDDPMDEWYHVDGSIFGDENWSRTGRPAQ